MREKRFIGYDEFFFEYLSTSFLVLLLTTFIPIEDRMNGMIPDLIFLLLKTNSFLSAEFWSS